MPSGQHDRWQRALRRWRWAQVLAAVWLLVVLGLVLWQQWRPGWRAVQRQAAGGQSPAWLGRVFAEENCLGQVDRCRTCHPPGSGHPRSLAGHLEHQSGCGHCHGGTGRALEAKAAHARPGSDGPDPLLRPPYSQAACAACHLPGAVPGSERLAAGALLYLRLGCLQCHPLGSETGGQDFGPDLTTLGRRGVEQLRRDVTEPAADFPGSTMPSFRMTFAEAPKRLDDLVIYLLSLNLPTGTAAAAGAWCRSRENYWQGLLERPCATCHGADGRSGGSFTHGCTYLRERRGELLCANCHRGDAGAGWGGFCPLVQRHRTNCVVCHRDRRGGNS